MKKKILNAKLFLVLFLMILLTGCRNSPSTVEKSSKTLEMIENVTEKSPEIQPDLVEKKDENVGGGNTAAPIFKDIVLKLNSYLYFLYIKQVFIMEII